MPKREEGCCISAATAGSPTVQPQWFLWRRLGVAVQRRCDGVVQRQHNMLLRRRWGALLQVWAVGVSGERQCQIPFFVGFFSLFFEGLLGTLSKLDR
jgi:hypothetical protein